MNSKCYLDITLRKIEDIMKETDLTITEGAAILGVLLAEMCMADVEKSLYTYASCMGSFTKTLQSN